MKIVVFIFLTLLLFPGSAFCAESALMKSGDKKMSVKIRLLFDGQEVVVSMFDNPASHDFLKLLPLDAEFKDYAGVEKITYLPRKLDSSGSPTARTATGDFTYYSPWGNIAVFYKGFGSDGQLYVLGRIESGKDRLAAMANSFTARIERIE
jgi:hypothetical protein